MLLVMSPEALDRGNLKPQRQQNRGKKTKDLFPVPRSLFPRTDIHTLNPGIRGAGEIGSVSGRAC